MDIFPKFIIEDGWIVIRKCTFHIDIAVDVEDVSGGGWFLYQDEGDKKAFLLYSSSDRFGACSLDDIQAAVSEGKVGRYIGDDNSRYLSFEFRYSTCSMISCALDNYIVITK